MEKCKAATAPVRKLIRRIPRLRICIPFRIWSTQDTGVHRTASALWATMSKSIADICSWQRAAERRRFNAQTHWEEDPGAKSLPLNDNDTGSYAFYRGSFLAPPAREYFIRARNPISARAHACKMRPQTWTPGGDFPRRYDGFALGSCRARRDNSPGEESAPRLLSLIYSGCGWLLAL